MQENKLTQYSSEIIKKWENEINNVLNPLSWLQEYKKYFILTSFIASQEENKNMYIIQKRIIFRINKIIQQHFVNKIPFKFTITLEKINDEGSYPLETQIHGNNHLGKFVFALGSDFIIYFFDQDNQIIHQFKTGSALTRVWPINLYDKEDSEKAENIIFQTNKNWFEDQNFWNGEYLLACLQGKLWIYSPWFEVRSKKNNLTEKLNKIDFQVGVYKANKWLFDAKLENNKTIIYKQCYYDKKCDPIEQITKYSYDDEDNFNEEILWSILQEYDPFLKTMFSGSDKVIDVWIVLRSLIWEKINNVQKINKIAGYTTIKDWTLKKVYEKVINSKAIDPENDHDFNLSIITQKKTIWWFNVAKKIQQISKKDKINLAIKFLTEMSWDHESIKNGQDLFTFIYRHLLLIDPQFKIKSKNNNLNQLIEDLNFAIVIFLENENVYEFNLNLKCIKISKNDYGAKCYQTIIN